MAGDGSDDFEPREAVSPLPPRREPPLIEGKAEQGLEPGEYGNPAGMTSGPNAADEALTGASLQNTAPPQKKSGGAALPLSILFGALIAVGGAFGLHYYDTSSSAVGEFQSRLDALTEKTDALSGLNAKVDSLAASNGSLTDKVATLEAELNKAPDQTSKQEFDQAGSDIEKRLSALEASLAALPKAEDNVAVNPAPDSDLQKKIAALQDAVDASSKSNISLQAEVQKISDAQKALIEKPSPALAAVNLGPLDSRLSKIEGKFPAIEASLADEKTAIRAVQDKLAAPPPGQDQNAAIVAITLLQRVQQGLPFETELAALGTLNIDAGKLSILKASAAKGVASARALSEEFRQLAPSLLKESEKSPPGQSFLDRLAGDAAHLVRIERMGDQTSTDVPSLINRIETALDQNDVDAAYALWMQLPPPEKAISASFGDAMKTRLESVSASWSIASGAVANLSKPKS